MKLGKVAPSLKYPKSVNSTLFRLTRLINAFVYEIDVLPETFSISALHYMSAKLSIF